MRVFASCCPLLDNVLTRSRDSYKADEVAQTFPEFIIVPMSVAEMTHLKFRNIVNSSANCDRCSPLPSTPRPCSR